MAVNLSKGQKVDLTKSNPGLSKLLVGLGWDVNKYDGGSDFDLDVSVFLLAHHFSVSEDEIIDAVHSTHGVTFSDYIESLRIEHAVKLLDEQKEHFHTDDQDDMVRLAHQCGYLERSAFERSFQKVMQTSLKDYRQ